MNINCFILLELSVLIAHISTKFRKVNKKIISSSDYLEDQYFIERKYFKIYY